VKVFCFKLNPPTSKKKGNSRGKIKHGYVILHREGKENAGLEDHPTLNYQQKKGVTLSGAKISVNT